MESMTVKRQDIPSGWVIEDGVAMPWWYSTVRSCLQLRDSSSITDKKYRAARSSSGASSSSP
jgi:hypothetical protein